MEIGHLCVFLVAAAAAAQPPAVAAAGPAWAPGTGYDAAAAGIAAAGLAAPPVGRPWPAGAVYGAQGGSLVHLRIETTPAPAGRAEDDAAAVHDAAGAQLGGSRGGPGGDGPAPDEVLAGSRRALGRRDDSCEEQQPHDDSDDGPDEALADTELGQPADENASLMREADEYSEAEFNRLSPDLGLGSLESTGPSSRLRSILKKNQGVSAGSPLRTAAWALYATDVADSLFVDLKAWDRAALMASIIPVVDCGVYAVSAEMGGDVDALDSFLCVAGDVLLVSGVGAIPGLAVHAVRAVRDALLGRELPSEEDLLALRDKQWTRYLGKMHAYLESDGLAAIARVYLHVDLAVILFEATEAWGLLRAGKRRALANEGRSPLELERIKSVFRSNVVAIQDGAGDEMRALKGRLRDELAEIVWDSLIHEADLFNQKFIAGFEADVANGTYDSSVLSWLLGNRHANVESLVDTLHNRPLIVPRIERVSRFVGMRLDAIQLPRLCAMDPAAGSVRHPCVGLVDDDDDDGGGGGGGDGDDDGDGDSDNDSDQGARRADPGLVPGVREPRRPAKESPCDAFDKIWVDVAASDDREDSSWDRMTFDFGSADLYVSVKRTETGVFWRRSLPTRSLFGSDKVPVASINWISLTDIWSSEPKSQQDAWTLRGVLLTGHCAGSGQMRQVDKFQWLNEQFNNARRWRGTAGWSGNVGPADWKEMTENRIESWHRSKDF